MKRFIKNIINNLGYRIYKTKILPKGFDLVLDINRRSKEPLRLIFDVGANIGQTAREFHREFPKAEIFSFEPVRETFKILQENTQHLNRVRCFNNAFGKQEGKAEIFLQDLSGKNSMLAKNASQNHGSETIELLTIDNFAEIHQIESIDLLKTDTEGYDLEVLKGAERYLDEGKISFIMSEVGFNRRDSGHTFFPNILDYLNDKNYQLVDIYESTPVLYLHNRFGFANALFMHNKIAEKCCSWRNGRWKIRY